MPRSVQDALYRRDEARWRIRRLSWLAGGGAVVASAVLGVVFSQVLPGHSAAAGTSGPAAGSGAAPGSSGARGGGAAALRTGQNSGNGSAQQPAQGQPAQSQPAQNQPTQSQPTQAPPAPTQAPPQVTSGGS